MGRPEASSRWRRVWLFHPLLDLGVLVVPIVLTLAAWAIGAGQTTTVSRAYAGWLAQFVLGDTTHVILTFLLLGTRREVLHATRGQARTVIVGSLVTMALTAAMLWSLKTRLPAFEGFGIAAVLVFAQHHALAQVKGFWSLYNLRGMQAGVKPGDGERSVMQNFAAIALLFSLVRVLFVTRTPGSSTPFISALPGEPALLDYWVSYPMLAAWLAYAAWVMRALLGAETRNPVKIAYVSIHLSIVALTMLTPGWGAVLRSGVHGLEYFAISSRMLWPRDDGERSGWLRGALVVPAMMTVMAPIFVVGLLVSPMTSGWTGASLAKWFGVDGHMGIVVIVVNAVVMAHYFADAFIYRFRIPEVRRVALARLGF